MLWMWLRRVSIVSGFVLALLCGFAPGRGHKVELLGVLLSLLLAWSAGAVGRPAEDHSG